MSSRQTFKRDKIQYDDIILLQGGGNFGDLWRINQDFRLKVIKSFPNNRIIILPQTIYYNKKSNIEKDAQIINNHNNITICARDKKSFDVIGSYFPNAKKLLLPDMAFYINKSDIICHYKNKNKNLVLKRNDHESIPDNKFDFIKNNTELYEFRDWPTLEKSDSIQLMGTLLLKTNNLVRNKLSFITDMYYQNLYKHLMIKKGVKFILSYNNIYTTRLHVAILCVLLEKKCFFIDNSYGKNFNFYDTWLKDLDGLDFIY